MSALAQGALDAPAGADWADVEVGGLRTTVVAPLERWTVAWEGTDQGFELELEAVSAPAELESADPVARLGGMAGYEQLVRVRGTVRAGGERDAGRRPRPARPLVGRRRLEPARAVRTVSAWLGEEEGGIVLSSLRPAGRQGPRRRRPSGRRSSSTASPCPVVDPRLSTTYDGDGHQRRAGLELWMTEEDGYPHRAAGEVLCGSSLDLGALRLDMAFMRWHAEGVERRRPLRRAAQGLSRARQLSVPRRSQT